MFNKGDLVQYCRVALDSYIEIEEKRGHTYKSELFKVISVEDAGKSCECILTGKPEFGSHDGFFSQCFRLISRQTKFGRILIIYDQ